MDCTFDIHGGLGDFFCYLHMDRFKDHPLQLVKALKTAEPDAKVNLNIYSATPDSARLFEYSPYIDSVHLHEPDLYERKDIILPYTERCSDIIGLTKEEEEFYLSLVGKRLCAVHLFSSTPYKVLPEKISKKKIVDTLIDKYGYTVIFFHYPPEKFDYKREGLIRLSDHFESISRLGFWIIGRLAQKIVAINSAYLMLRNIFLPLSQQNTLALFWEGVGVHEYALKTGYHYVKDLNVSPNMYVYYSQIAGREDKLIDRFMEKKWTTN